MRVGHARGLRHAVELLLRHARHALRLEGDLGAGAGDGAGAPGTAGGHRRYVIKIVIASSFLDKWCGYRLTFC